MAKIIATSLTNLIFGKKYKSAGIEDEMKYHSAADDHFVTIKKEPSDWQLFLFLEI
jgi:hypothetical protein